MKYVTRLLAFTVVFLFSVTVSLQAQLIETDELAKILTDKNVRVLDVQKSKNYKRHHIKGAIHLNYNALTNKTPVPGTLKPPAELAKIFGDLGISPDNKIVIYDEKSGKGSSRVYAVLKYLGANDVVILNGQLLKWMKEKRPITSRKPRIKKTTFTPKLNPNIFVDAAYVKAHLDDPNVQLLDARTPEEYNGQKGKYKPLGHIKNAILLPYSRFVNPDGTFKSKAEIDKIAREAGFNPEKEIITYCVTAVRASVAYFALHEIARWPNVRIYEGSYADFVHNYPELTVK